MFNPQLIRDAFNSKLEQGKRETKLPVGLIPDPDVFYRNLENSLRIAAFDHAAQVAARALKTSDAEKVRAAMRRAHVVYMPKVVQIWDFGDGTPPKAITRYATAEIAA